MAKIWYKLVKSGVKTLEDVPEIWREEVRKMLEDDEKKDDPSQSE